jgi:hypothetical protein
LWKTILENLLLLPDIFALQKELTCSQGYNEASMQPMVVFPFHDPQKVTFPHLLAVTPDLKKVFSGAFVGVSYVTLECCREQLNALAEDPFFTLTHLPAEGLTGDQFLALYRWAARIVQPEQVLHLAFIDRLAFILQSGYREQFLEDVRSLKDDETPLIFARSARAWATHPRNYFEIEGMVTTAGRLLFDKEIDFAWCQLALRAGKLRKVLPLVRNHDISMVAEMVLPLREEIRTKEVDWLAWEDPFVYSRDSQELKEEKEHSPEETCKRLAYAIPMLELLYEAVKNGGS